MARLAAAVSLSMCAVIGSLPTLAQEPNRLGLCGPADAPALIGSALHGAEREVRSLALGFEGAYPYLWLDAKQEKVRDRGHVVLDVLQHLGGDDHVEGGIGERESPSVAADRKAAALPCESAMRRADDLRRDALPTVFDPLKPEIMVYAPGPNGKLANECGLKAKSDQKRFEAQSDGEFDRTVPSQVPSVHSAVEATQRLAQTRRMRIRAPMRIDVKLLARSLRKMQGEIHLLMR